MQTLGALTTAMATTNAQVDRFTTNGVPQVVTGHNHPGPMRLSAVENPPAAISSAEPDQASFEETASLAPTAWKPVRRRSRLCPTGGQG